MSDINPPPKMRDFPLDAIGDNLVRLLQESGIPQPAIMLLIVDLDTGEMCSSGNLDAKDSGEMMRQFYAAHQSGAYDEEITAQMQERKDN